MEIYEILKNHSKDLLAEDLEILRTELAVGDYHDDYRKRCTELMEQIEKWNAHDSSKPEKKEQPKAQKDISDVTPRHQGKTAMPFLQQFQADLNAMRLSDKYKSSFRTYIKTHEEFDERFVDDNFGIFEEYEIEAILSELTFSEQFLEKYFSVLDKDKIARYQLFSESFYQKHFSDFDAATVLKKGKNEWKKKENRSKQFAVFLRLKGVQF